MSWYIEDHPLRMGVNRARPFYSIAEAKICRVSPIKNVCTFIFDRNLTYPCVFITVHQSILPTCDYSLLVNL